MWLETYPTKQVTYQYYSETWDGSRSFLVKEPSQPVAEFRKYTSARELAEFLREARIRSNRVVLANSLDGKIGSSDFPSVPHLVLERCGEFTVRGESPELTEIANEVIRLDGL